MTSQHFHAVIWIDHHEAKVFHFNAIEMEHETMRPDGPPMHVHHKRKTVGSGHEALDSAFLHDVTSSIAEVGAALILGPGTAKTELMAHIKHHDPKLLEKIKGVETIDHPSDGQIVAHARKFFKSEHQMQPR